MGNWIQTGIVIRNSMIMIMKLAYLSHNYCGDHHVYLASFNIQSYIQEIERIKKKLIIIIDIIIDVNAKFSLQMFGLERDRDSIGVIGTEPSDSPLAFIFND